MTEKSMCVEGKETKEKKERDELFFCLLPKCSIRLLSYIYIYSSHRAQVKKKSGKKRRVVFNDNTTLFFYCVCVFVFFTLSFFILYVCAHLASANTSMRARVDR